MPELYRQYTKVIKHMALFDKESEAKKWASSMLPSAVERLIQPIDGVWMLTWTTTETRYG